MLFAEMRAFFSLSTPFTSARRSWSACMTCFTSSSTNSRQQLPLPGPSSRFFKSRLRSILSKRILLASSIYIIALFLFYINLSPSPPHASLSSSIPHLIWTYHEPPPHNTTPSVSIENRIKSWQRYNSISNVTLILPGTLASHISTPTPPNFASLTMRQRTEWVKLAVLLEHGGVWMDTDVVVTENIAGMLEKREACWEKKVKDGETVQLADSYVWMDQTDRHNNRTSGDVKNLVINTAFIASIPRGRFIWAWFNELNTAYVNFGSHRAYATYLRKLHAFNDTSSTGDEAVRTSQLAAAKVLTVDAGMGVPMPRGLWGRAWGVEEVT